MRTTIKQLQKRVINMKVIAVGMIVMGTRKLSLQQQLIKNPLKCSHPLSANLEGTTHILHLKVGEQEEKFSIAASQPVSGERKTRNCN